MAKLLCNLSVVLVTVFGMLVIAIWPDRMEQYSAYVVALIALYGPWFAAIFGGTWIDRKGKLTGSGGEGGK